MQYANYTLMLLNDATHNVSEVVNVIRSSFEASRCSLKQASDLTEFVDREGRAALVVGEYKDCAAMRDRMNTMCRAQGLEVPLKTKILPSYVVAHQNFAVRLLDWVARLFTRCSGFRALFSQVVFCVSL